MKYLFFTEAEAPVWKSNPHFIFQTANMSDMCDIYITEIKSVLRRADELIAQGRNDNSRKDINTPVTLVSFVGEVEKQLREADDCFKQCDIEIRMLPSSIKASVASKVETLRKECESKKRQVNNLKAQVERSDLLGGAAV